jgi:DNA-binding NarL/FixJ family response regulator
MRKRMRKQVQQKTNAFLDGLSKRQYDVMCLVVRGMSNKGIARELGIAEGTVKIHLHHVYRKLGISSRAQLSVRAISTFSLLSHPRHEIMPEAG